MSLLNLSLTWGTLYSKLRQVIFSWKASIITTGKVVFAVRTASEAFQSDIDKAVEILEEAGCRIFFNGITKAS